MRTGFKMNNDDKDPCRFVDDSEDDDDDDSTTRSNSPDYISYKNRPEWADVEPVSIKTQTSIMDIKYTARYEEAFSYFRAMLVKDERSERSLELTADCIELQRSNFSVWYFRRRILRKLKHHLADELTFVERAIEIEPKNYQVWHHRKTIVEWLRDGSHEKRLTASVITVDNKNYHAWQHRQWAIKEFNLWEGELEFTDAHLVLDIRNNSAWNHRFYVVKETRRYEYKLWIDEELSMVHKRIENMPDNESSWSYLRGLLMLKFYNLTDHEETLTFCDNLYSVKNCRSPHLLAFNLDVIQEHLNQTTKSARTQLDKMALKTKADNLCKTLSEIDKVRSRYWTYIGLKIKEL